MNDLRTTQSSRATLYPALMIAIIWTLGAALTHWVGVWGGIGGVAISLGSVLLSLYWKSQEPLFRLQRSGLVLGITAGGVMIAATYLLYPVFAGLFPELPVRTHQLYGLFNSGSPTLRLGILPLVILGEEIVWRGVFQSSVTRRLGTAGGVLVTALIYAAVHAPIGAPLLTLVAFCCGVYWSLLRDRTNSLVPGLLSHFAWDAVVMVLFPLVRF